MNQQPFNQEIEDSFEEDYDDSKELHDLIDGRLEASIICRDNKKIPNFLSLVYANNLFYLMFDIDENGAILGKLAEWKEWIEKPSTQDEYDERMKMMRSLG